LSFLWQGPQGEPGPPGQQGNPGPQVSLSCCAVMGEDGIFSMKMDSCKIF
jgi:hypothetical protein